MEGTLWHLPIGVVLKMHVGGGGSLMINKDLDHWLIFQLTTRKAPII
jgi:hypothetical protein